MDKALPTAVIFSGAGLSNESGIPTFRDSNGLWHNHKVEDVATPEGWKNNQQLVVDFYAERWKNIKDCEPNAGHKAIAKLQEKFNVLNITQNIDDLLERGGCNNVWHMHGQINNRKCEFHKSCTMLDGDSVYKCDYKVEGHDGPVQMGDKCPKCGGQMRPDVVWFGEAVYWDDNALAEIIPSTKVFIGVGTSAQVYPAAGLLYTFRETEKKYFVDPNPPMRLQSFTKVAGKAGEHLPQIVESLLQEF